MFAFVPHRVMITLAVTLLGFDVAASIARAETNREEVCRSIEERGGQVIWLGRELSHQGVTG